MLERKTKADKKDKDVGMKKITFYTKWWGKVCLTSRPLSRELKRSKTASHMGEKHSRARKQLSTKVLKSVAT